MGSAAQVKNTVIITIEDDSTATESPKKKTSLGPWLDPIGVAARAAHRRTQATKLVVVSISTIAANLQLFD